MFVFPSRMLPSFSTFLTSNPTTINPGAQLPPTRPPGLYEELVTRRLEAALEEIRGQGWRDEVEQLDAAEAPGVLALHLDARTRHHNGGIDRPPNPMSF